MVCLYRTAYFRDRLVLCLYVYKTINGGVDMAKRMKKVTLMMLAVALMLSSCAEKKTFKKCDGTSFVASPYGWANKEKQIDGVDYEINVPNIILSVIFSETIVCPIVLTAVELWEPVNYTEPNTTK